MAKRRKQNTPNLIEVLGTKLLPTGLESFEGLIAELLTELTGVYFRRSRGGSQQGRDAGAFPSGANIIAVECKRYTVADLSNRELLGEMVQAISATPNLNIWALVTSTTVDAQLTNELLQAAEEWGIEYVSIEGGDGSPSSLEALCATGSEITLKFMANSLSSLELQNLAQWLQEIAEHSNFAQTVDRLRNDFLRPSIGLASWQRAMRRRYLEQISSLEKSKAAFGQELHVRDRAVSLIPREQLWEALDRWFDSWSAERSPFAVLGEEGDGKTWGVASWCNRRLDADADFLPPLFVSSSFLQSEDPEELLQKISRKIRSLQAERWLQRLSRWLDAPQSNARPLCILVLDGVNERHAYQLWRALLDKLAGDSRFRGIAVILTCRTEYWNRTFGRLSHPTFIAYELQPYNDEELREALVTRGLSIADFGDDLLPLVRKPRYFDLAVRFRSRLTEAGDFTKARLIYEEWKDRWGRKSGTPLSDQDFRVVLRELARKHRQGASMLGHQEVITSLPSEYDLPGLLQELRTSGVLRAKQDGASFVVDQNRLEFGLGLLLADQVIDSSKAEVGELVELALSWLEPKSGMDIKANICEYAVLHALQVDEASTPARTALLLVWLDSQNPRLDSEAAIVSYMPVDPLCYVAVAEHIWSDAGENRWAQSVWMQAFLHWYVRSPRVKQVLAEAFDRWLTFVHLSGFPWSRGTQDDNRQIVEQKIRERIHEPIISDQVQMCGRTFQVVDDDGLLRLGRVALAVISHLPRQEFIASIADACVAEAVMGQAAKYELFQWILSTSQDSLWPLVERAADRLMQYPSIVAQQAAARLLSFEGSVQADKKRQLLPAALFPVNPFLQEYRANPCTSGLTWEREHCEVCMEHPDLDIRYIARQINHYSADPTLSVPRRVQDGLRTLLDDVSVTEIWSMFATGETDHSYSQYELILCAFAPFTVAGFIRKVLQSFEERGAFAQRQLSFHLSEFALLIDRAEVDVLASAWRALCSLPDTQWEEAHEVAEMSLLSVLLPHMAPEDQLKALLQRPEKAVDLRHFERLFEPLEDWRPVEQFFRAAESTVALRRVLWFISKHSRRIPADILDQSILPLLQHSDSIVRSLVLKSIYWSQHRSALDCAAQCWSWNPSNSELENHWGSLALTSAGIEIDYNRLAERVHPAYWALALTQQRDKRESLHLYAVLLDSYWSQVTSNIIAPDDPVQAKLVVNHDEMARWLLDTNEDSHATASWSSRYNSWGGGTHNSITQQVERLFDVEYLAKRRQIQMDRLREIVKLQRDGKNYWFAERFFDEALEQIIAHEPELVKRWLTPVGVDTPQALSMLYACHSFYEALFVALCKVAPSVAIPLHAQLQRASMVTVDSLAGWKLIDIALFDAAAEESVITYWQDVLRTRKTDRDLLHIVCLAERGKQKDWLVEYVVKTIDSQSPLQKSLATTLLGFIDSNQTHSVLRDKAVEAPQTWYGELVALSTERSNNNSNAKHWLRRFFASESNEEAWAAFRLLLACVDSRFWTWHRTLRTEYSTSPGYLQRRQFLQENSGAVRNCIRDNEKSLEKCLYGQKVQNGEVWPWME